MQNTNLVKKISLTLFIFILLIFNVFTLFPRELSKTTMDTYKILDSINCIKDDVFDIYSNFLINIPIDIQLKHGGVQAESGIDTIAETISYAYDYKIISLLPEQILYLWLESTVDYINNRDTTLEEVKRRTKVYGFNYNTVFSSYKIAIDKKINQLVENKLRVPKIHTKDFIKALVKYYQNLGDQEYLDTLVKAYKNIPLRNSRFKMQKFLAIDLTRGVYNSVRNEYNKQFDGGFDND